MKNSEKYSSINKNSCCPNCYTIIPNLQQFSIKMKTFQKQKFKKFILKIQAIDKKFSKDTHLSTKILVFFLSTNKNSRYPNYYITLPKSTIVLYKIKKISKIAI